MATPLQMLRWLADTRGGASRRVKTVTDSDGRATLIMGESGRWYLRTIHMVRLPEDPEAEWESFWSTLTFEVLP